MKKVKVYNLYKNEFHEWDIPSKEELIANSELTWGKRWDKIEHEVVEGGLPMACYKLGH